MQLLIGECLGVTRENREYNGSSWIETKIHVLDQITMKSSEVTCVKEFRGEVPTRGDFCAIEIGVRAFSGKSGAGFGLSAFARAPQLEAAMRPVWDKAVKALETGTPPVSAVS